MNLRAETSPNKTTQINGFQGIPAQIEKITVLRYLGIGKTGFEGVFDAGAQFKWHGIPLVFLRSSDATVPLRF